MLFGCGGILTPDRFGTVLRTMFPKLTRFGKENVTSSAVNREDQPSKVPLLPEGPTENGRAALQMKGKPGRVIGQEMGKNKRSKGMDMEYERASTMPKVESE